MKKNRFIVSFFVFFFVLPHLYGEIFKFQYRENESYKIISRVTEDVYINGNYSQTSDILNKIMLTVGSVKNGAGFLNAVYQTSERADGDTGVFNWSEEYSSAFWQDSKGKYDISPEYYMPMVRDVPMFPYEDVLKGDSWTLDGYEVHDFRSNFGVPEPYTFPITVHYTYLGKTEKDGGLYDLISIHYDVFYRAEKKYKDIPLYPVVLSGTSSLLLYWDNTRGMFYADQEEFEFLVVLSSGITVEYRGKAEGKVIESSEMDRPEVAESIKKKLENQDLGNTAVNVDSRGVTITLEDIQFLADSAVLLNKEKIKLQKIVRILEEYPDRDILITGHTARAGSEEEQLKLSKMRAKAVGDYILSLGVKKAEQISIRGVGAAMPVADNATERGREKNRRVELTILEN